MTLIDDNTGLNLGPPPSANGRPVDPEPLTTQTDIVVPPAAGMDVQLSIAPDAKVRQVNVEVFAVANNSETLLTTHEGNLFSLGARQKFVERVSKQFRLTDKQSEALGMQLERKWPEFYKALQADRIASKAEITAEQLLADTPHDVRLEAQTMLENPNLMDEIAKDLKSVGIAGEAELAVTIYLVMTSRLLSNPLSARVHGPTTTGKSYVASKVGRLVPPEALITATRLTSQALYHMAPGSLAHRAILAGERTRIESEETAEATRALREMQSAGRLSKLLTVKVRGEMTTQLVEQDGPIAFIENTSLSQVFSEDANRSLTLFTDETKDQTRRIAKATALRYRGDSNKDVNKIVDKHFCMQRMLQAGDVVIPYALELAEKLESTYRHVEMRRGIEHIMSTIAASALLHQYQRDRDSEGRIKASAWDYRVARLLLAQPLMRLLGRGVPRQAMNFLKRLVTREPPLNRPFTIKDVQIGETVSKAAVQGWVHDLGDAGLLNKVQEAKGPHPATWDLTAKSFSSEKVDETDLLLNAEAASVMPEVDEICSTAS